jgi:hypothetical protein
MRICILVVLLLTGCTNAAFEYAKSRHPGCNVMLLSETRDSIKVLVECMGTEPFEQTFRKR